MFQILEKSWDNQLATMIATDDSIAAFGDGAHAVEITPDDTLRIGETDTVFGIEITLDDAGFVETVENTYPESEYWFVEFTGRSISNEIQYGINPKIEAQLQYLQSQSKFYNWEHEKFEQSKCKYKNTSEGFEPGASFHCRFVYLVPSDERNLYWIYARTDNGADGSYEERYIVFQIR
ncbi:MAG: hypothetical protein GY938_15200 [Ketobacter sp.]|nr:hypothetical protein [Ketobacter sp.]